MKLIPVIDLLGNHVVHARKGQRSQYLPIRSSLCEGSQPLSVVGALLGLYPFATLYIADLDAIQRRGDNTDAIAAIRHRFPHLELWVDSGIGDEAALQRWIDAGLGVPVIGSESLNAAAFMLTALESSQQFPPVLSLDFMGDTFKGPHELLSNPSVYWPTRLLAMNLVRVGGDSGPDLALIERLAHAAVAREVYCAGGVRTSADLDQVRKAGGAGALIASALHDGRLTRADLARWDDARQPR